MTPSMGWIRCWGNPHSQVGSTVPGPWIGTMSWPGHPNLVVEATKHWNRPPREGMELPSLEAFEKYVDVALGDMV